MTNLNNHGETYTANFSEYMINKTSANEEATNSQQLSLDDLVSSMSLPSAPSSPSSSASSSRSTSSSSLSELSCSSDSIGSTWSSVLYLPCLYPNLYRPFSYDYALDFFSKNWSSSICSSSSLNSSSCSSLASSFINQAESNNPNDEFANYKRPLQQAPPSIEEINRSVENLLNMRQALNLSLNAAALELKDITNMTQEQQSEVFMSLLNSPRPRFVAPRFEKKWLQNQNQPYVDYVEPNHHQQHQEISLNSYKSNVNQVHGGGEKKFKKFSNRKNNNNENFYSNFNEYNPKMNHMNRRNLNHNLNNYKPSSYLNENAPKHNSFANAAHLNNPNSNNNNNHNYYNYHNNSAKTTPNHHNNIYSKPNHYQNSKFFFSKLNNSPSSPSVSPSKSQMAVNASTVTTFESPNSNAQQLQNVQHVQVENGNNYVYYSSNRYRNNLLKTRS